PRELDAGGRVVKQEHVNTAVTAQAFALVMSEVTLGDFLQVTRPALVIGRTVTAADAAAADLFAVVADVNDVTTRQIHQARQDLAPADFEMLVEPDEVLVIAFDEDRAPRRRALLGEPDGEVPRALVVTGGLVYPVRIRPDAEVADVKDIVETHAERLLEGEDIVVEPIHGSMNVAGGADEHDVLVVLSMKRCAAMRCENCTRLRGHCSKARAPSRGTYSAGSWTWTAQASGDE